MKVTDALIVVDRVCDYVPGASTITNLVDIFEKCVLTSCCTPSFINSNRYFSHVNEKSKWRCALLLVPVLGNIIIAIDDLVRLKQKQAAIKETIKNLDRLINAGRMCVEQFSAISNPGEVLFEGSKDRKADFHWGWIKLAFATQAIARSLLIFEGFDQDKTISQKLQEAASLNKELVQLRQKSYRDYVQGLGKDELLEEAHKYCRQILPEKEHEAVGQLTLDTILPKLQEIVAKSKNDFDVIEIQEIISRLTS